MHVSFARVLDLEVDDKWLAKLSVVLNYFDDMTNTFILGVALVILTCSINIVENVSNFEAKVDDFLKEVSYFILCFFLLSRRNPEYRNMT